MDPRCFRDIIGLIARSLDLVTFARLKISCRAFNMYLTRHPDIHPLTYRSRALVRTYFDAYMRRFRRLLQGVQVETVCRVCVDTGIIYDLADVPRGDIFQDNPLYCFNGRLNVYCMRILSNEDRRKIAKYMAFQ